ncbi:MAG: DUF882 domain-containing protein [bacterium]|nr:DUF882 domain-containing protein [bacterium]
MRRWPSTARCGTTATTRSSRSTSPAGPPARRGCEAARPSPSTWFWPRSAATNAGCAAAAPAAATASYHIDGTRRGREPPGVKLSQLRGAARDLKSGGVGYYPGSRFVHLDTGPVRTW